MYENNTVHKYQWINNFISKINTLGSMDKGTYMNDNSNPVITDDFKEVFLFLLSEVGHIEIKDGRILVKNAKGLSDFSLGNIQEFSHILKKIDEFSVLIIRKRKLIKSHSVAFMRFNGFLKFISLYNIAINLDTPLSLKVMDDDGNLNIPVIRNLSDEFGFRFTNLICHKPDGTTEEIPGFTLLDYSIEYCIGKAVVHGTYDIDHKTGEVNVYPKEEKFLSNLGIFEVVAKVVKGRFEVTAKEVFESIFVDTDDVDGHYTKMISGVLKDIGFKSKLIGKKKKHKVFCRLNIDSINPEVIEKAEVKILENLSNEVPEEKEIKVIDLTEKQNQYESHVEEYVKNTDIISLTEYCARYFECVPAHLGKVSSSKLSRTFSNQGFHYINNKAFKTLVRYGANFSEEEIDEYSRKVIDFQLRTLGITINDNYVYPEWMTNDDKLNHSYLERFFLLLMEEKSLAITEIFPSHTKPNWTKRVIDYLFSLNLIQRNGNNTFEFTYSLIQDNQNELTSELINEIIYKFPNDASLGRKSSDEKITETTDIDDSIEIEEHEDLDSSKIETIESIEDKDERIGLLESHISEIHGILSNYREIIVDLRSRIQHLENELGVNEDNND